MPKDINLPKETLTNKNSGSTDGFNQAQIRTHHDNFIFQKTKNFKRRI